MELEDVLRQVNSHDCDVHVVTSATAIAHVRFSPRRRGQSIPLGGARSSSKPARKRLLGDTTREATAPEVQGLRQENTRLKQALAETVLENRLLKKSLRGSGSEDDTCG